MRAGDGRKLLHPVGASTHEDTQLGSQTKFAIGRIPRAQQNYSVSCCRRCRFCFGLYGVDDDRFFPALRGRGVN